MSTTRVISYFVVFTVLIATVYIFARSDKNVVTNNQSTKEYTLPDKSDKNENNFSQPEISLSEPKNEVIEVYDEERGNDFDCASLVDEEEMLSCYEKSYEDEAKVDNYSLEYGEGDNGSFSKDKFDLPESLTESNLIEVEYIYE